MNFPYIIMFIQIYHHNEKLNLLKSFGCILFEIYRCIASFRCDIVIIWPHTYNTIGCANTGRKFAQIELNLVMVIIISSIK